MLRVPCWGYRWVRRVGVRVVVGGLMLVTIGWVLGEGLNGTREETQVAMETLSSLKASSNSQGYHDNVTHRGRGWKSGRARRLPNVLIIGAKKCGTGALRSYLAAHPDVRAYKGEAHFFDALYKQGLESYRALMPPSLPHQLTIEKTPRYFIHPSTPQLVRSMNSSIKLILMVRDPALRTYSDFIHEKYHLGRRRYRNKTFDDIILKRGAGGRVAVRDALLIVQPSLYERHWLRWIAVFNRSQIHVIDGDRFVLQPLEELGRVEKFLGLRPALEDLLEPLLYRNKRGFFCRKDTGCLSSKGEKHAPMTSHVKQVMQDYFRPSTIRFLRMVNMTCDWPTVTSSL